MADIVTLFIDSNVLLRLLIGDLPIQQRKAKRIFGAIEEGNVIGLISIVVINEVIWIMENFYDKDRIDYIPQLIEILSLKKVQVIEVKKIDLLIILKTLIQSKIDFTDEYLSFFSCKQGNPVFSFDKDFDKRKNVRRIEDLKL